ncbi:MAG: hypothetical protein H6Q89_5598 [Myxococcaceae bacterium]|nr:hypothetical protein [Myxococcaceae bacterium]
MDLFLEKKKLRVTDADLLGEGGEARVYRYQQLALKVFHQIDAQKIEKLLKFPRALPSAVVGPVGLLHDKKDAIVGYAMQAVPGAEELARLSQRRWREGAVSNEAVQRLFANLCTVVGEVHRAGVVIGDFNDGNVLFRGEAPYLIDADSMQFSGLPCSVGHERFLDPRLYGADLSAAPRFEPGTDWYAWSVLLFSSLLYVHPFGGIHPKYATPLRRAEARHSVLRADVTYPRHAVHFRVLPDDALGWFERVFEQDERSAAPPAVLGLKWSRCPCGLEHARAVCPECQTLGPASTRQALRSQGRCTARTVFRTTGRVLAAAMRGGLRYVYEEGGVVRREDGAEVMHGAVPAGTRFFIGGASTWIADVRGSVVRVDGGGVAERTSTGVRGTSPVFAASSSAAYRTEGEWLLDEVTGARVGQVLEGQTWIWTGERLGFGFYRAGGFTFAFLVQPGRAGLREVKLPHLKGRLVDAEAVFDDAHVLLSYVLEVDGKETTFLWLFGADGTLRAQASGPSSERMFAGARGRALLHGRVVAATDQGLLSLKADGGRLVEGTLFADTEPFVSAGDELYPQSDGSLYAVGTREVVQLTLS